MNGGRKFAGSGGGSRPAVRGPVVGQTKVRNNYPIKPGVSFLDILTNKSHSVGEEDVVEVDPSVFSLSDLRGRAVVSRALGLIELSSLKSSLASAGYEKINFQYLGGLSVIISFDNGGSANDFLEDKEVWAKWFSSLNPWLGQSVPFERIAWISIVGVPPHLVSRDVFNAIGCKYGKVVQQSQFLESDGDLSYDRLGILLGSGNRINGALTLKWQDKRFKVWVIEENDHWLPEFLEEDDFSVGASSEMGGNMDIPEGENVSGSREKEVQVSPDAGGIAEQSQVPIGPFPHNDPLPGHVEREKGGADFLEVPVVEPINVEGIRLGSKVVGPEVARGFKSGSGERRNRTYRRGVLGLKSTKAQTQSKGNKEISPDAIRPKKRSRNYEKVEEPGFGFVGFTSRSQSQLDLNRRAQSSETLAADSLSQGNRYKEALFRNQVEVSDKELVATVEIGAQVGVEFGSKSEQVNIILGSSGINEVEI
ncbi:hypothetical protein HanRHA438_Chr11g0487901 [Helianthus annuus]|nr:hypothetical protein HanHA300_Chr11g0389361 [Helianthus annuus]KAJ0507906.1 hypothetical protein HanIR_Chr11g0511361 [Helianthus annuus]KAJ0688246.1 hypothetical protein HanOQP8_Chr11g0392211 [Helianthus annuus]KAJ0869323.1 hypothetical protein HanRHA438_Chr11g0487901 [Helianthus annuus]